MKVLIGRLWNVSEETATTSCMWLKLEAGISDAEVLQRANDLSALLLTLDKDFGELVFQQSLRTSLGVVLIRLSGVTVERKAEIVSAAFHRHERDFLGSFSVITSGRVRIKAKR